MACDPCHGEGFPGEPSIGDCSVSACPNSPVCGPPPHRSNGRVHGEHCSCLKGCGRIFCKPHARIHAKTHSGPGAGTGCFPHLALITSAPVVVGSLVADARFPGDTEGTDAEARFFLLAHDQQLGRLIGDFLTDTTPGVAALVAASVTERREQPLWIIEQGIMIGPTEIVPPRLTPGVGFYTRARLERVTCLALTVFGEAWSILRGRHQETGYAPSPEAEEAWDECALWARGMRSAPSALDLRWWLVPIARRWDPLDAPILDVAQLSPAFAAAAAPSDELERARWLVGPTLDQDHPVGRERATA